MPSLATHSPDNPGGIDLNLPTRIVRHAGITAKNYRDLLSPPFLILFIHSVCYMKCEYRFYWQHLNGRDDLTTEELVELSGSLGQFKNLSLSGGEPFLRKDLTRVFRQFICHNLVRQIYVPINGYFTERTVRLVNETLDERQLGLFVVELSLDGMAEFHDRFRGTPGAFDRTMKTYDALADLQAQDPRLRIHAPSTATSVNISGITQRDQALDNVSIPTLPPNGPSQLGQHTARPQRPVPVDAKPAGLSTAVRVHRAAVAAEGDQPLWRDRRANDAIGQAPNPGSAKASHSP
jgi:organic radical activating enzyme